MSLPHSVQRPGQGAGGASGGAREFIPPLAYAAVAAGAAAPDLASSLGLPAVYAAQAGQLEDMDRVAAKLVAAFPAL